MILSFADPLPVLWETALKTSTILAAAAGLSYVFRRASAASRFLTWQLGIVGVLALTISSFAVTPRWHVIPAGPSLFSRTGSTPAADVTRIRMSPPRPRSALEANPADDAKSARSAPESSTSLAATAGAASISPDAAPALHISRFSLAMALDGLWLAGAACILLRLLVGAVATRWLTRRAAPVDAQRWAKLNETMSLALGLARPVSILKSARASTPMTFGVLEPVVLLPADADEWPEERRRVVLLHELAHVRRFDCFTNLLATTACALYWFNPMVWFAVHRMRMEGECACDDWVLRAGVKASSYADHLLDLVHTLGQLPTPATALPMAQRSTFEGRLLAILEPSMNRTGVRRGHAALLVAAFGAIALPLSAMTTVSASATPQIAAETPRAREREANMRPALAPAAASDWQPRRPRALRPVEAPTPATRPVLASESPARQRISAAAVDALIAATKDADASVRLATIKALAESGDPRAVAALSDALRSDKDPAVRRAAAWGLGNLGDARAVPALEVALKGDTDVEVRRTAVWALGEIGDRSASPAIIAGLNDRDAEVRKESVWALGEMADRAAAPSIEHLLNDKDPAVREQAVWALGEIGSHESAPAIATVIHDTSASVRNEAVWALGEIGDRSSGMAISGVVTSDADERVRETAAWALGELGDQEAVSTLSTALSDPSPRVVAMAAWALGEISPHSAPPRLMSALSDANTEVRRNAVWALGQIQDPAAVSALRQALHDSDTDVKRSAMHALARMGDAAAESAIADMLKDPDPSVRKEAAAALGGRSGGWADPRPRPRPQPRPQPRPFGW